MELINLDKNLYHISHDMYKITITELTTSRTYYDNIDYFPDKIVANSMIHMIKNNKYTMHRKMGDDNINTLYIKFGYVNKVKVYNYCRSDEQIIESFNSFNKDVLPVKKNNMNI